MDSGVAAILGAAIGGLASFGGTVYAEHRRTARAESLDKVRREVLRKLLHDGRKRWRPIAELAAFVGADERDTAALLLEIGARRSLAERPHWGLKEWPEDIASGRAEA